jgi:hypothetical protein
METDSVMIRWVPNLTGLVKGSPNLCGAMTIKGQQKAFWAEYVQRQSRINGFE